MTVKVVVFVHINGFGGFSETCGLANVFLIRWPHARRAHEGFIVKPRWHHLAANFSNVRHQVEGDARPTCHRRTHQPVVQGLLGGANVGNLGRFCRANLHDGIRLIRTGGDNATRATVFKTAPNNINTIGQQRRRQRITLIARQGCAVVGKVQWFVTINTSARVGTICLCHHTAPYFLVASAGFVISSTGCGSAPSK